MGSRQQRGEDGAEESVDLQERQGNDRNERGFGKTVEKM
jgi:hypothetical protein